MEHRACAPDRKLDGAPIAELSGHDPRAARQVRRKAPRIAYQHPYRPPLGQQPGHHAPADEPGGTGDQHVGAHHLPPAVVSALKPSGAGSTGTSSSASCSRTPRRKGTATAWSSSAQASPAAESMAQCC